VRQGASPNRGGSLRRQGFRPFSDNSKSRRFPSFRWAERNGRRPRSAATIDCSWDVVSGRAGGAAADMDQQRAPERPAWRQRSRGGARPTTSPWLRTPGRESPPGRLGCIARKNDIPEGDFSHSLGLPQRSAGDPRSASRGVGFQPARPETATKPNSSRPKFRQTGRFVATARPNPAPFRTPTLGRSIPEGNACPSAFSSQQPWTEGPFGEFVIEPTSEETAVPASHTCGDVALDFISIHRSQTLFVALEGQQLTCLWTSRACPPTNSLTLALLEVPIPRVPEQQFRCARRRLRRRKKLTPIR
jgi:hypothetical protein